MRFKLCSLAVMTAVRLVPCGDVAVTLADFEHPDSSLPSNSRRAVKSSHALELIVWMLFLKFCQAVCLSVCPSICLFVRLFVCLSVYLFVCQSGCLSLCQIFIFHTYELLQAIDTKVRYISIRPTRVSKKLST